MHFVYIIIILVPEILSLRVVMLDKGRENENNFLKKNFI